MGKQRQSLRCVFGLHKMVSIGKPFLWPNEYFRCARCGAEFQCIPNLGYRRVNKDKTS